jgi:hypothetical protein
MDSTRDAVVVLDIGLGDDVFFVDRSLGQVTQSCRLDHVADSEAFNGLILKYD